MKAARCFSTHKSKVSKRARITLDLEPHLPSHEPQLLALPFFFDDDNFGFYEDESFDEDDDGICSYLGTNRIDCIADGQRRGAQLTFWRKATHPYDFLKNFYSSANLDHY